MLPFLTKSAAAMQSSSEKSWPGKSQYAPLQHNDRQHDPEPPSPTDSDCSSEQGLLGWERKKRSPSRHAWIPITLLVLVSNLLSAIMGAMLGEANMDLNKACSHYTSEYCAWLVVDPAYMMANVLQRPS